MSGEETLFLGIRSTTLGASLLMVAFVATTHVALKWWTRRRYRREVARSDDHPGEERGIAHWVASSLLDLVAPVALILWVHGLHYALSTLMHELPYPALARYGLPALDGLRGVGTVLALMWLLSRVGRSIEARLVQYAARTGGHRDDLFVPIIGTAIRLLRFLQQRYPAACRDCG